MTGHPEVQNKLQQEVDEVIGHRDAKLSDRPNMSYMEAVCIMSANNTIEFSGK